MLTVKVARQLVFGVSLILTSFSAGYNFPQVMLTAQAGDFCTDPGSIGNCTSLDIVDQNCILGCYEGNPHCSDRTCCERVEYQCHAPFRLRYYVKTCDSARCNPVREAGI